MSPLLEGGAIHFLPLLPLHLLVLVVPPESPLLAGVDSRPGRGAVFDREGCKGSWKTSGSCFLV